MIYSNCILLLGVFVFRYTNGQEKLETFCNINGERAIQYVSEKFLSISIDPAVLLAGLNLSDSSLVLAQHLSPAYIRIAGPSTKFVQYQDNEDKSTDRLSQDGSSVVVTPSMWFGINEWLKLANLTPVFGINDVETARGVWNPKSTLPLLEISDKLNVTCYWQLGFDSSQKSETQYKQDLNILYHLLNAFPGRNETWKIIGSDISTLPIEHTENTMEELKDIVTAVMWEPKGVTEDTFPEKDMGWKILHQQHKPNAKIWTSVPKSSEPISFSSTLLWAMQVGDAAKYGYDVVFRQPRLHEIFSDTPAYWFSLLHKKLMGSNVLDARTTIYYPGSVAYAHCTRKQDDSVGRGALTVMIVNNNLQKYKTKVKLGTAPLEKSMRVLSYILTAPAENSTEIYLNGKKLSIDLLSDNNVFQPKQRRTKSKSYVSFEIPPQSIGFFVLPDAKIPVCQNEEKQVNNATEEIIEEQNSILSEEKVLGLTSRSSFIKNPTLQETAQRMKKEMQSDERFYKHSSRLGGQKKELGSAEDTTNTSGRKTFIEKAKLAAKERKRVDLEKRKDELRKFLSEKTKAANIYNPEPRIQVQSKNLELTSEEVERILKDRAKARAAQRNIIFTDEELDALLQKASKQFLKSKFKRPVLEDDSRRKRDINMQVLEKQVNLEAKADAKEKYGHDTNKSQRIHKRAERKPRDINMKLLDFRTRVAENKQRIEDKRHEILGNTQTYLAENKQRMENKKYELLGNTQTMKENIKDKIRNLKYNKNRYKRDINMDLLKIKTEGQKKAMQRDAEKKPIKTLFKHREHKEATIRKPGQTSAELLEELEEEEEEPIEEQQVMPKKEVYAELADSEEDGEESDDIDFFNANNKAKKSGMFDKRPHDTFSPKSSRKKKKKDKNTLDENLQFLTTSEEFTDIQDDLPCIHEFFGHDYKVSNGKKVVHELGESRMPERKTKKVKLANRKMIELEDAMMSSEKDPFEELRRKRDLEKVESVVLTMSSDGLDGLNDEDDKLISDSNALLGTQEVIKSNDIGGISEKLPKTVHEESIKIKLTDTSESVALEDQSISQISSVSEDSQSNKSIDGKKKVSITERPTKSTNGIKSGAELTHGLADVSNELEELANENDEDYSKSKEMGATSKGGKLQLSELRHKRDIDENAEVKERGNTYNKPRMQHIKDLKQPMVNDKLKLEEEKIKNKLKLAHMKRKQHDSIVKEKDDLKREMHGIEKAKTTQILEQLELLKKIITQRKKEIDKSIKKDTALQEKPEEHRRSKSQDKQILTALYGNRQPKVDGLRKHVSAPQNNMNTVKEKLKIIPQGDSMGKDSVNTPIPVQSSPMVHLTKRSLFDKYPGGFGSYKPLTVNLKSWKPSDILSLKRDSTLLSSRNLKPTNDYQLYTNMFDQNRHTKFGKRSINDNFNVIDNHIDKDINDIGKDGKYVIPKMMTGKRGPTIVTTEGKNKDKGYIASVSTNESEKGGKSMDTPVEDETAFAVTSTESYKETGATIDPIIFYTYDYGFGTEIQNDSDRVIADIANTTACASTMHLPEHAQGILKKFVTNVSGFFKQIGSELGHYVKKITLFED